MESLLLNCCLKIIIWYNLKIIMLITWVIWARRVVDETFHAVTVDTHLNNKHWQVAYSYSAKTRETNTTAAMQLRNSGESKCQITTSISRPYYTRTFQIDLKFHHRIDLKGLGFWITYYPYEMFAIVSCKTSFCSQITFSRSINFNFKARHRFLSYYRLLRRRINKWCTPLK